ncbi:hypothetical protein [Gemmata sp.]|uniref:hypothetical protein n=1 Tax=Gemmata sp. TaxID=1914242 RepID=UPI003F720F5E
MDRRTGSAVAALVVVLVIFGAKQVLLVDRTDHKKAAQEALDKHAADRARRLAGQDPPYQLEDAKEDFSVTFPSRPTPTDVVLVGLNVGLDKDWELPWLDDTTYSVRRRGTAKQVADEEAYVRAAAGRKIDRENKVKQGRPEQWVVGEHREFRLRDQFPAAEFAYTYKKFSHQEARSGRVLIVKVPGDLYYLQADGPPDVISAPVTERFFASFRYAPKEQPARKP